ncbi:hypothetical protein GCM10027416_29880 [Okibacterium endophyticum]
MPSFRVTMPIGALRAGVAAESVVPAAAAAASQIAVVEASDLGIVAGRAQVIVRFTAEDAETALQVGGHVAAVTNRLAEAPSWKVTERVRGRWYVVRS